MSWEEIFYRQFPNLDLITVLEEVERRWPLATLSRAREGIGNICVYSNDGEYVAVIELRSPPELCLVPD